MTKKIDRYWFKVFLLIRRYCFILLLLFFAFTSNAQQSYSNILAKNKVQEIHSFKIRDSKNYLSQIEHVDVSGRIFKSILLEEDGDTNNITTTYFDTIGRVSKEIADFGDNSYLKIIIDSNQYFGDSAMVVTKSFRGKVTTDRYRITKNDRFRIMELIDSTGNVTVRGKYQLTGNRRVEISKGIKGDKGFNKVVDVFSKGRKVSGRIISKRSGYTEKIKSNYSYDSRGLISKICQKYNKKELNGCYKYEYILRPE